MLFLGGLSAQDRESSDALRYNSSLEEKVIADFKRGVTVSMTDLYLAVDQPGNIDNTLSETRELDEFVSSLRSKQHRWDEERFLKHVFYKTHRKFLKFYKNHTSLNQLFDNGNYDCLSATSLFVLILDALDFEYIIKETDYHVYLLVKTAAKNYLFESTDPLSGFVADSEEIRRRAHFYKEGAGEPGEVTGLSSDKQSYHFSRAVDNSINKIQLAGLHYYNKGILLYNQQHYLEALKEIQKGLIFYNSPRIKEFLALVLEVALNSEQVTSEDKKLIQLHQNTVRQYGFLMSSAVSNN